MGSDPDEHKWIVLLIPHGLLMFFQDAIAWAIGLDVTTVPTPWFNRAWEYGERAWRVVGVDMAAVCWDCGNGWMDIVTLEPLCPMGPSEFQAAAVKFYERLSEAMQNPDLNSGDECPEPA